ncbi:hypothetical protein [Vibrio pelagius]|uniref:hypothetical protein n=1 Tax=Vibrio pelagius TaxID=28169 RepID=UPI003550FDD6
MKNVLFTVLLTSLFSMHSVHASDLNSLSTTYDQAARYEMSENDVKSFVYQWFAAFDHQRESGYFLNRIADSVQMQYPDFPIASEEDFLRWYQGVTDNIVWNAHSIQGMKVTGDQKSGWLVSYDVNWKATSKDGQNYDAMVHQELRVIRIGDALKLAQLEAEIIK